MGLERELTAGDFQTYAIQLVVKKLHSLLQNLRGDSRPEMIFKKLPENEIWFTGCLDRCLEAAFEVNKSLFVKDILDHIGNVKRFDKALVKCIAKIYAGKDATGRASMYGLRRTSTLRRTSAF